MTIIRFSLLILAAALVSSPALSLSDTVIQQLKPPGVVAGAVPPASAAKPTIAAAVPAAQSFAEESALVPVKIGGETVRLEMLFVKAQGASGRLPVVLISHGKPATQAEMAAVHATNYRTVAHDFARRGWLAVAVVRRGYGLSEGKFLAAGNCKVGFDLMRQFRAEGEDLEATLDVVKQRADADPARILAIGVSNGGVASLALSAMKPKGLQAVINISGGLRSRECPFDDNLVAAFHTLGSQASAPSLWLYAENDSFFPPEIAGRLKNAYAQGPEPVTYVRLPPVSDDGHKLFSATEGRILWWPEVDRFLRTLNLPTWPPEMVDQVMLQNELDPKHRPTIERYISAPGEKALVKGAAGGTVHWWAGTETTDEAARRAVAACVERKGTPCTVIMRNADAPAQGATAAGGSPVKKTP